MSKSDAQIRLHLELRSTNLTPEELSAKLGVNFDQCHQMGEPRARTPLKGAWWQQNKRFWDQHWWILHEVADSTYASVYKDLPVCLDRLLSRVEMNWQAFANLAAGGSGELRVAIVSEGYPGMGFDSELVQRIARLNVYIDFDLYCEPEPVHDDQPS